MSTEDLIEKRAILRTLTERLMLIDDFGATKNDLIESHMKSLSVLDNDIIRLQCDDWGQWSDDLVYEDQLEVLQFRETVASYLAKQKSNTKQPREENEDVQVPKIDNGGIKCYQNNIESKCELPEVELIEYDLSSINYYNWRVQYEECIEKLNISSESKLLYLRKTLKREAFASEPSLEMALQLLHSEHGIREKQVNAHVKQLVRFATKKDKKGCCCDRSVCLNTSSSLLSLKGLGLFNDMVLFPLVESTLPDNVLNDWTDSQKKSQKEPINASERMENLIVFLLELLLRTQTAD